MGGFAHALSNLLRFKGLNVLIGVVQHRMEMRQEIDQLIVDPVNLLPHRTGELSHSVLGSGDRLSIDQIDHRFRLGQIHLAIQKGAAGKFPCLGLSGASGEQGFQASMVGEPWHCNSAVSSPV